MSRVQKLADLHSALLDLSAATPGEPAAVEEFFDMVEAILAQREPPENAPRDRRHDPHCVSFAAIGAALDA